jgi:hypothetical protein
MTMFLNREMHWWYWAATDVLLIGGLSDCPLGFWPVIGLTVVQVLHYFGREGSLSAFPVQVRLGYLGLLLLGQWDVFYFVYWVQLAGTTAMVLVDYCALARFLSLMPWNRREPLSLSLVLRTFLSPPVKGNILQGLPPLRILRMRTLNPPSLT